MNNNNGILSEKLADLLTKEETQAKKNKINFENEGNIS